MDAKTKTEAVLPELVNAVREDFAWAAERLREAIARLQALEEQLRHDHDARTCCRGTAKALQTFVETLDKESTDYAGRTLPDREGPSETTSLRISA